MLYMSSISSSTGQLTMTVYFSLDTDPDIAQVQVQNRVNLAMPQLPSAVVQQGVNVQKKSSSIMMLVAVYAKDDRYSANYIANYANVYVLDALKRVNGAGQAQIMGVPNQAMRIWMNPDRMASLQITTSDIANAISQQNQLFGAGQIGQQPNAGPVELTFPVITQPQYTEPKQYENIILRASQDGSAIVRVGDVARAEFGLQQYIVDSKMNGVPATIIAVYQQPGANGLVVSDAVRKTMEQMKASFPDGMEYLVALDTNDFVRLSIKEVHQDAARGGRAGDPRRLPVPAELPHHAHLHRGDRDRLDRHVHRHAGARLLDQPPHAVRFGVGDRHGGRRRDRRLRERRAQHAPASSRAEGGDDPLDGRDRELARRHRPRDVLGIHSRRLPAGDHGPALQAVRDHDRDLGVGVGLHRADRHARDVRGSAEAPARRKCASSSGSTARSTASRRRSAPP